MCAVDMPLNGGCLAPLDIRIPEGSLLAPGEEAAVCGGNVMTSQRITDVSISPLSVENLRAEMRLAVQVVLKAFNACAASQGCCNNLVRLLLTLSVRSRARELICRA